MSRSNRHSRAVGQESRGVAAGLIESEAVGAVGDLSGIAVEEQDHRAAGFGRGEPQHEGFAIGCGKRNRFDPGQAERSGAGSRRVGKYSRSRWKA